MTIRTVMKAKGLTNESLAKRIGIPSSRLAAYKSGGRSLGETDATRLAPHLGQSPEHLMLENRISRVGKAIERDDRRGVLTAAKSFIKVAEGGDGEYEDLADQMFETAMKFLEGTGSGPPGLMEDYENLDDDGRDALGRRVVKSMPRAATPEESAAYWSASEDSEDEDDGRDALGRRRPMKEVR